MKYFLFLVLVTSAHSIRVGCRYSYYTFVGTVIENEPTCNVISLDFSDNSTHFTSANGTWEQIMRTRIIYFGWTHFTRCQQLNLTFIPQGISSVFPNMIGLTFDNCPILNLIGTELNEYRNLEFWSWTNTQLENGRIPGNFFSLSPKLRMVDFWRSGVMHVGNGLLDNLNDLQNLMFQNNICINQAAMNPTAVREMIPELMRRCPDPYSVGMKDGPFWLLIYLGVLVVSVMKKN